MLNQVHPHLRCKSNTIKVTLPTGSFHAIESLLPAQNLFAPEVHKTCEVGTICSQPLTCRVSLSLSPPSQETCEFSKLGVSERASAKMASAIGVRIDDVGPIQKIFRIGFPFWREFCFFLPLRVAPGVDTEFPYRVRIVDRRVDCRDPVCRHRFRFLDKQESPGQRRLRTLLGLQKAS